MSLFDNVKYLVYKNGMSLPEFSEKLGLQRTAVYKWKTSIPSVEMIDKVAKFFDVSIEFLIDSDNTPEWTKGNTGFDIDFLLQSDDTVLYANKELTDSEKKRVKVVLDALFID